MILAVPGGPWMNEYPINILVHSAQVVVAKVSNITAISLY